VQGEDGEHAGLDIGADGDYGTAKLLNAQLTQCVAIGRIRLHDMGDLVRPALHQVGVLVDCEHVVPQARE
jgi:hypothetical protein